MRIFFPIITSGTVIVMLLVNLVDKNSVLCFSSNALITSRCRRCTNSFHISDNQNLTSILTPYSFFRSSKPSLLYGVVHKLLLLNRRYSQSFLPSLVNISHRCNICLLSQCIQAIHSAVLAGSRATCADGKLISVGVMQREPQVPNLPWFKTYKKKMVASITKRPCD